MSCSCLGFTECNPDDWKKLVNDKRVTALVELRREVSWAPLEELSKALNTLSEVRMRALIPSSYVSELSCRV